VAGFGDKALDVAELVAGIFPGGGTIVTAIRQADMVIERIAAAAPKVRAAVEAGTPILEAAQQHGPALIENLKALYAIAVNADPVRPETNLKAADVTAEQAATFGVPVLMVHGWTQEETQRWWDRAQGQS
jgi:pyridoxine 5'-phosphate synthase PdxJ